MSINDDGMWPPRLHIGLNDNLHIVARDRAKGNILVGGLGVMGVGQMWSPEDSEHHASYPGYEDAPEVDSTGGFGLRD